MKTAHDKKHIVWFANIEELDINKEQNRKWWIKQVLLNGRLEDITDLDFNEVEKILPGLYLPKPIKKLWENYFEWKRKGTIDGTPARDHQYP